MIDPKFDNGINYRDVKSSDKSFDEFVSRGSQDEIVSSVGDWSETFDWAPVYLNEDGWFIVGWDWTTEKIIHR